MVEINKKPIRAVVLMSGGLDSAIAANLVKKQGIDIYGLNFHSPFCTCNNQGKNGQSRCGAIFFAKKIGIPIKTLIKGDEYLEMIKKPSYGYGKNLNPCIDCRIFILRKAVKYMEEIGGSFLITGEVLGQRPKSQNLKAMQIIEKEANIEGRLLRPLSAGILKPTIMEKNGIINRKDMLNIKGRRRNIQLELGKKMDLITHYCAGGGCRLTAKHYANKVKDYLSYMKKPKMEDMKFLSIGRHFRHSKWKIIVGKNEEENHKLKFWAEESDLLLEAVEIPSPITLIQNPFGKSIPKNIINYAAKLTTRYSDCNNNSCQVRILNDYPNFKSKNLEIILEKIKNDELQKFRVN